MREVSLGETLDQYKLVDLIARSGMASIFKAIDLTDGKDVVVKIPYQQFESDVVFYDRFKREEEVGRKLDHPNIVKVLAPKRKSRMYMAMELVDGQSLRALMRDNNGRIPRERALEIARQIVRALIYMHGQGVVHRDLKPENILITPNGQVKIMDFGIALDESARRLTWSGLSSTVGTPDYMAPEQVAGRRGDARTDVYSLGTILYEMLVGELPYAAPNVYGVMRAKTSVDPQPPSKFDSNIDPHLEELVLHAIERRPNDRYASATAMLEELEHPENVHLAGRAHRLHPQNLRAQKFRRVAGVALFFLSLIGFFIFLIWLANRYPAAPSKPGMPNRGEVR
jgi:eukaryotic-like serine/threonine-protein kinase